MSQAQSADTNGTLQGTLFKKCDRAQHRPGSRKACANGTCQHTCEPAAAETCRHAWTVRHSVAGKLWEKSFRDEIDERTKRVKPGSGKKKAEDFRLKLSHDKRAQGKSFTDPALGKQSWTEHAEEWIFNSARLKASADSRQKYAGALKGELTKVFGKWTLEDMCTEAAADKAGELVNVRLGHRSLECRRLARMIIVRSMDAAVRAGKVQGAPPPATGTHRGPSRTACYARASAPRTCLTAPSPSGLPHWPT